VQKFLEKKLAFEGVKLFPRNRPIFKTKNFLGACCCPIKGSLRVGRSRGFPISLACGSALEKK